MKVLLCERNFSGHRRVYLEWLSKIDGPEFYSFAPENTGLPSRHFIEFRSDHSLRSFKSYLSWARQIRQIVRKNGIDVVHILDGDSIMRYFGLGLASLKCGKIVTTYHNFYPGTARRMSYRMMNPGNRHTCVVHTEALVRQMKSAGLKNVRHCEYPAFEFDRLAAMNAAECRNKLGLREGIPVIGIVGGLNRYKHILPFLNIMRQCREDFQLLICGLPTEITAEELNSAAAPYSDRVHTVLKLLTDEEYRTAVAASDILYSVYDSGFQGASGPLTDGVCAHKMILSCAHGSLGEITSNHHLGLTADVTSEADILRQTENALRHALAFQYDQEAEAYREQLRPETFMKTYKSIYLA